MMDYSELVKDLREHRCYAKEDDTQDVCEECAYDVIIADKSTFSGIKDVCTCGLMHRAADAIEELLKAAKKMHTWIYLNTRNEQKAYDECGLSDEMNAALGYGGMIELRAELPKEET